MVVSLIGVMLFFTIPRLNQSFFIPDSRKLTTWLQLHVTELKDQAEKKQLVLALYVDMDENRMWTGPAAMDEAAMETAKSRAMVLSGENRLIAVIYPEEQRVSDGIAEIGFYPGGYSDPAVIHVETSDHQRVFYKIPSFLSRVRIGEGPDAF